MNERVDIISFNIYTKQPNSREISHLRSKDLCDPVPLWGGACSVTRAAEWALCAEHLQGTPDHLWWTYCEFPSTGYIVLNGYLGKELESSCWDSPMWRTEVTDLLGKHVCNATQCIWPWNTRCGWTGDRRGGNELPLLQQVGARGLSL